MYRTIQYYQLFCPKNKYGEEEAVGAYLDFNTAKQAFEEANKGWYSKHFKTAKAPFYIREMEYDFDMKAKDTVF